MSDKNTAVPDAQSYKNLVDLMALHAEGVNRLAELENEFLQEYLAMVDTRRKEYADLQQKIADSQEGIELAATLNPQWFEKSKTLKTPYGTVAFRKTTKLNVKNEEVSIVLIEQFTELLGDKEKEVAESYIRTNKELDLEALEKLSDAELKKFRITRETTESCTVKAAKIDLGKAVKKAAETSVL
jgi:hypothetical protein